MIFFYRYCCLFLFVECVCVCVCVSLVFVASSCCRCRSFFAFFISTSDFKFLVFALIFFVIIHPTSASGIIVSLKTPQNIDKSS